MSRRMESKLFLHHTLMPPLHCTALETGSYTTFIFEGLGLPVVVQALYDKYLGAGMRMPDA